MIARLWRGWARPSEAEEYARHLETEVLPGLRAVPGFQGCLLLRAEKDGEVEFLVQTLWASMAAVRAFAGEQPEVAVVHETARRLLSRYEEVAQHYEAEVLPGAAH